MAAVGPKHPGLAVYLSGQLRVCPSSPLKKKDSLMKKTLLIPFLFTGLMACDGSDSLVNPTH
ncbi:MAG: hypothetical protein CMH56_05420 [Myxococcales bacterium]|nr:hypothetical protein [Myxococcales bacterium]